ncbi:uncharacterized protein [Heptranchias perlo]|uniref:uncharacterized protein n=1 Tax=Heptranchias perlo TaxID=212740 RepID=UPI00355A1D3E
MKAIPASALLLLALLVNRCGCCMNCDKRLWSKFLDMMNRCLAVASEQECTSQLQPVLTYTKDFTLVHSDAMIQAFLKLMDLIYPFMFNLEYEPLDMMHAFLQVKLKAAVCDNDCNDNYPVQVMYCANCSVNTVKCNSPIICSDLERRKRKRRSVEGSDPQVAEKWRLAEMIMFPMIAILLIMLVAVLVIILLWMKQSRENLAKCSLGFRYRKEDETVVPTY